MRKSFLQLFAVVALGTSLWSCNGNSTGGDTPPTQKADSNADETITSVKEVNKANQILKAQQTCLETLPADCQTPDAYCNDPACMIEVDSCHQLTFQEFDALVEDWGDNKVRTRDEVYEQVINGVNCVNSRVRVRYTVVFGLSLSTEPLPAEKLKLSTSYYSIALFKAIFNRPEISRPEIFTFYKGVKVDGGKIVPFKVEFANGNVGYYDLSDSQP